MATNQYYPFANGGGANTLTNSAYAALTTLLSNGYQSGLASSQEINTTFRQASVVAAAVAQFIVNISAVNANDDGNVSEFATNLAAAVRSALTANVNEWTTQQYGEQIAVPPVGSGSTLTLPFATGNNFIVSPVAANFVLGNPTGAQPGQSGVITFVQNATGSFTFTSRGSLWKGVGGARVNLTAGANGVDELPYYVEYNGNIVLFASNNIS